MPPKPHRVVIERVTGYASEAAAFMRRRRHTRRPFARVVRADGSGIEHPPGTGIGDRLQAIAIEAIEVQEGAESQL